MNFITKWWAKAKDQARKGKVDWRVVPGHEIKLAFELNGVEYYEFTTGYNTYYERYMAAIDRMAEIEMRCSSEYLDLFQKVMEQYIKTGDFMGASLILQNLKDVRSYVSSVELLYKLASVWYFTKNENCYKYDYELAEEKIKVWKKDKGMLDFFLQSPIISYLPPFPTSKISIEDFSKVEDLKRLLMLKLHFTRLSKESNNEDLTSTLSLQIKELEELISIRYSE